MASIAPKYQVRLRDQSGVLTAIFDDWVDMEFTKEVNNIGSYKFQINGEDARRSLFELDGQVEIWRQVAGCGLGWYKEFEGFHRLDSRSTDKEGNRIFVSDGVGLNDLLARSIIAYKAGTIRADKNAPAETVMKEYVDENCGPTADDTVVGRLYQGGFPNLPGQFLVLHLRRAAWIRSYLYEHGRGKWAERGWKLSGYVLDPDRNDPRHRVHPRPPGRGERGDRVRSGRRFDARHPHPFGRDSHCRLPLEPARG